jgi:small subunit ribosomal protein S8e
MVQWHLRTKTKKSGGTIGKKRDKKLYERGSDPTHTKIGKKMELLQHRGRGKTIKHKLKTATEANITDPISKKTFKAKILTVKENLADRQFARRNIITKGALIETEKGLARVTSRPGQHGVVNAVLIK